MTITRTTIPLKNSKHFCLKENLLDLLTGEQTNLRKGNSKTEYFYLYFCYVLNVIFVENPAIVPAIFFFVSGDSETV